MSMLKFKNKRQPTSVVAYCCFCGSKWANVSDLVGFALTVTTRYNCSNIYIIAKLSYFNKINGVAG